MCGCGAVPIGMEYDTTETTLPSPQWQIEGRALEGIARQQAEIEALRERHTERSQLDPLARASVSLFACIE